MKRRLRRKERKKREEAADGEIRGENKKRRE